MGTAESLTRVWEPGGGVSAMLWVTSSPVRTTWADGTGDKDKGSELTVAVDRW